MKKIAVLLIVLAAVGCARKAETPASSSASVPKPAPANPTFDLVRAWRAKEVVIKSQSMTFTMTPKTAPSWIAVELTLTQDAATPVRANYPLTIIDAAGARTKSTFSYPIDAAEVSDDGAKITFTDDPSKLINGTLIEMGGKLIAVFESPADVTGLKLELPGEPAIDVTLQ